MARAVSRRDVDGVTRLKAPVLPAPQFQRDRGDLDPRPPRRRRCRPHLQGQRGTRRIATGLPLDYSAPGTAQFVILFCWQRFSFGHRNGSHDQDRVDTQ